MRCSRSSSDNGPSADSGAGAGGLPRVRSANMNGSVLEASPSSSRDSGEWEMEGTLAKKGHLRTNWKSRLFRLRGSKLAYFSGASPGARPKGTVELTGARVAAASHHERQHCLEVVEAAGRRYLLSAPSAEAQVAWLATLRLRTASPSGSAGGSPAHLSSGAPDVLVLGDDGPVDEDWTVLVLGDAGVGKTSLLLRFCMDQFVPPDPMGVRPAPDLARARTHRRVRVAGQTVRLALLDTQGSEIFRTISTGKYMAADAVVLVFAHGGGSESLARCEVWWREAQKYIRGGAPFVLAGNKADLPISPEVRARAAKLASTIDDAPYLECSAATGDRVNELFMQVARSIARQRAPRVFA